jgi:hypothetical protein
VTGRRGRRHKQLLDNLKEKRKHSTALCTELALEGVMKLSQDGQRNKYMNIFC